MAENTVKHVIRFPADVYAKLKKLAEMDSRSINGEVVTAVKALIEEHEKQQGPIQAQPIPRPNSAP